MNYLAHLFLAESTPESLIGNLLGDFVKGSAKQLYPDEIRRGIEFHQKVDLYTDSHEIVRSGKKMVNVERRRFAGIMIDVFYDHFLAKNWSNYSKIPLLSFSNHVYTILQDNQEILPDSLKRLLPEIISQDWLTSYREIHAIENTLKRIATRIKRENNLADGIEDLKSNYQKFESDFFAFFPDLINYTKTYRFQDCPTNS